MSFGNPPPKLGTLVRSLLPAALKRHLFRDVRTFVLFIGHARSGSSLVGSLLNAHRHALIAHELNAMHFVKRRFPRSVLYWLLYRQDQAFEQAGRQWAGYDYKVSGQWQGRSERLLVIGDKHASGASRLLGERPKLLARLQRAVGTVKMVHVIRHPLDNIATLHRRQNFPLPEAIDVYLRLAATNARLVREHPGDVVTIHHEDMIAQPQLELTRMCRFLDLDAPPAYLQACAATLFTSPRRTRSTVAWPAGAVEEIREGCRDVPFLQRYLDRSVWRVDGEGAELRRAA